MTLSQKSPSTLLDLIRAMPASKTAIIVPEQHLSITDAIPRTATGKIQRRVVAQVYARQAS